MNTNRKDENNDDRLTNIVTVFRHASRYASPEPTSHDEERLARQNENLLHYIEGWINVARQLIKQEEEQMINDNDNENLLDQIQVRCCSSVVCVCVFFLSR